MLYMTILSIILTILNTIPYEDQKATMTSTMTSIYHNPRMQHIYANFQANAEARVKGSILSMVDEKKNTTLI